MGVGSLERRLVRKRIRLSLRATEQPVWYNPRSVTQNQAQTETKKRKRRLRAALVQTLAHRKEAWEQRQEALSLYETNAMLTQWKRERPALSQVHSQERQVL